MTSYKRQPHILSIQHSKQTRKNKKLHMNNQ